MVDAGFSFTHAVPVFDWRVVWEGVRRVDLGGKALTNYMKELVSYRWVFGGGGGDLMCKARQCVGFNCFVAVLFVMLRCAWQRWKDSLVWLCTVHVILLHPCLQLR